MSRRVMALVAAAFVAAVSFGGAAASSSDLYTTVTVTSGTAPERRALGFGNCFRDILVKVSGDQRVLAEPAVAIEAGRAGELISTFAFRDRLSGVPMHDEQGSYDRPHDLTCVFDQAKLDAFLATLGRKPWLERPRLVAMVGIRDMKGAESLLAADAVAPRDQDMRTSLAAAAERQGLELVLPSQAALVAAHVDIGKLPKADPVTLSSLARAAGGDMTLVGTLVWNDKALGWVAEWHIAGQPTDWSTSGVGFDDAFRNGLGGAAQVLSGNEARK